MTSTQNFDKIVAFGKDNVEAFVKSSTVAVKGLEELTKVYTALANQSIEQTTSALKALSAAKSPVEFQTIYSTLAKSSFETFVAESKKIQDLTGTIVTNSFAPLNARIQAASGLFKTAA
jgi:phasin family protein